MVNRNLRNKEGGGEKEKKDEFITTDTTTTTTTTDDEGAKKVNNDESFVNKIVKTVTKKPWKKVYRIVLIGLLGVIMNNTSNVNISDLFTNIVKQNICHNETYLQL